ncbi:MAG: DUF2807 domain-containing protein [Tannerellaceae bacterium]|jgi:hypothetical protein|nr:DUF2807 domain-containing protein [Tannerellaceae bacterium]
MKTKTFYIIILIAIVAIAASPAAVKKETRQAAPFEAIFNSGGIDVIFTESASYSITVEADEDILKEIITEVSSGVLTVKRKSNFNGFNLFNRKGWSVKVHVSAPRLREIRASGGADFIAEKVTCDADCHIDLSGGADVKINSLTVNGSTKVSASGGADCTIKALRTTDADFDASGGADISIELEATGKISCSASGGADISLSGKADTVKANASGGADVNIRRLTRNHAETHKSGGGDVYQ